MESRKTIKSLIIAQLDGEINADEQKILSEWINQSSQNARYYVQVKDIWEASVSKGSVQVETEKEWKRFMYSTQKLEAKSKTKKSLKLIYSISAAAILLLGIIIGSLFIQSPFKNDPVFCTAISPVGSISKVILSDSTLIYLNAGSEVKYSVGEDNKIREVFLEGEAWFKVAKDKKREFIVRTPFYNVCVLGTEFNVKAYEADNNVVTTLEEGSVQIKGSDNFIVDKDIFLEPGEQLEFNKTNKSYQIKAVKTNLYTSWKDHKLEFVKMSLRDLIVLLERRYGVDIDVYDEEILAYHYSGTIKNESILDILNVLQHTLPVRYEIKGQVIQILKK